MREINLTCHFGVVNERSVKDPNGKRMETIGLVYDLKPTYESEDIKGSTYEAIRDFATPFFHKAPNGDDLVREILDGDIRTYWRGSHRIQKLIGYTAVSVWIYFDSELGMHRISLRMDWPVRHLKEVPEK